MSRSRPKVFAIVPAAGSGTRIGGDIKKQFLPLKGKPIIVHTLQQFEHCADVDEVAVALPESAMAEMEAIVGQDPSAQSQQNGRGRCEAAGLRSQCPAPVDLERFGYRPCA